MSTVRVIGVSIPKDLIQKIDADRGDINRKPLYQKISGGGLFAEGTAFKIDRHAPNQQNHFKT